MSLYCINFLKMVDKVFCLEDGTLGGTPEQLKANLLLLESTTAEINLFLNPLKCKVSYEDNPTRAAFLSSIPSAKPIYPSQVTLIGSPIGSMACVDTAIISKVEQLKILGERLKLLHAHDALCLLHHAFSLPKVLHLLRTAQCFQSSALAPFDEV